ncbi:FecR domain-containing protein [candidate division KSB1 bacterium]
MFLPLFLLCVGPDSRLKAQEREWGTAVAEVTLVLGEVSLESDSGSQAVSLHQRLQPEDRLRSGRESFCEITFRDGPLLRLDASSELVLTASGTDADQTISGRILAGRLWSNCAKIFGDPDRFKTQSPTCVCGIRGTVWRLDVDADSTTTCRVYEGRVSVQPSWSPLGTAVPDGPPGPPGETRGPRRIGSPSEVSLEEWLVIVRKNQEVVIGADRVRPTAGFFDPEADASLEWVRWNKARDRALGR